MPLLCICIYSVNCHAFTLPDSSVMSCFHFHLSRFLPRWITRLDLMGYEKVLIFVLRRVSL